MIAPPAFPSIRDYVSRLGDIGYWRPYLAEALGRHDLTDNEPTAGFNATYPTFVCGNVVVKLFGGFQAWRRGFDTERGAYAALSADPGISAPTVLGDGRLFVNEAAPWPYLITSRMTGIASWRAELSASQQQSLAVDLGRQVQQLHALRPTGVATHAEWSDLNRTKALEQSSLPPHLIAQADDYLARLEPMDSVFTHGDITANHVYVENGRLAGLIDWGDAMMADRHYELIQIYRDLFRCDKTLFGAFLEAADWPVGDDFARQALGQALHRQTVGSAQHHTMDVFEPIADRYPLQDIGTLDDLAVELFSV